VRSEEGAYLVDGPVLLAEALDAGVRIRSVYVEPDGARDAVQGVVARAAASGARVRDVVPGALAKVLDLVTPQSVVAVVDQHSVEAAELVAAARAGARPLLVLEAVADPGNVGTLVRVAEAAGCAGVVLVGACADLHNPKTVRATAGAAFRVRVATVAQFTEVSALLSAAGIDVVGSVGNGGVLPEQAPLAGAVAVVVGSEAHGLSTTALDSSDLLVTVPMEGEVESLNAAVAGSLLVFEAARQRRAGSNEPNAAQSNEPNAAQRSGGPTTSLGHNDDPVATGRPDPADPAPEHGSPPR
jgi:TrmH family RNA methyltransferase